MAIFMCNKIHMSTKNGRHKKGVRGSMPRYTDVKELQEKIDEYFKLSVTNGEDQYGKPWTIENYPLTMGGLAQHLDICYNTLLNYEKSYRNPKNTAITEDHVSSIKRAKAKVLRYANEAIYSKYTHGAQFTLKHNFAWTDKSQIESKNEHRTIEPGNTRAILMTKDGES